MALKSSEHHITHAKTVRAFIDNADDACLREEDFIFKSMFVFS